MEGVAVRKPFSAYQGAIDTSGWPDTTSCPSCRRIIPARFEIKNGCQYVKKYCPFEQREFETLLEKADQYPNRLSPQKEIPTFQPSIGTIGTGVTEADIPNLESIQNIMLHLTPRCNSTCKVCYDRLLYGRGELSLQQAEKIVRRFKHKSIYLFGGEPTVRQDLPELISMILESGNRPVLYTNGLRLAQRIYVRELAQSGLKVVYVSFDGFREEIYEKMRGGRHEYALKMAALENLEQERMQISVSLTAVRGVNDDQIGPIIDYLCEHPFIWELAILPLYLPGVDLNGGIDEQQLISREEINKRVIQHLSLDPAYYYWWYEAKAAFVNLVRGGFSSSALNWPSTDQLFLRRNGGKLEPLLGLDTLIRVTRALQARRWADPVWLQPMVARLFWMVLKSGARQAPLESRLMRECGVVRISEGTIRRSEDTLSLQRIVGLVYSGKGIIPMIPT